MSKYGYMVKFNGKYYNAGEEVPDDIQPPKAGVEPPKKEEKKPAETLPKQTATVAAAERPQMKKR